MSLLASVAAAAAVLVPATGRADPPRADTFSLGWVRLPGAEECPSPSVIAQAIEERLRRALFVSASQASVAIEARIEPTYAPHGWLATIVMTRPNGALVGTRVLTSDLAGCATIAGDVAFTIGVTVDREAGLRAPPQPIGPTGPRPRRPQPPRPPWSVETALAGVVWTNLMPAIVAGGSVSVLLRSPGLFAFEATAAAWAPTTLIRRAEPLAGGRDVGATLWGGYGTLAACVTRGRGEEWTLALCGGLLVGGQRADGVGFPGSIGSTQWLGGAVVRGRVSASIWRGLRAYAAAAVLAPLVHPIVVFGSTQADGTRTVVPIHEMPSLGSSFEFGLALTIGR